MTQKLIGIGIIIAVVAGLAYLGNLGFEHKQTAAAAAEENVRSLVTQFGSTLKNVSLLADDASEQIGREYGPYVGTEQLAAWQADPASAPGRLTSSPWPDRIEITSVTQLAESAYRVDGSVVEMTSDGPADTRPIALLVENRDGTWLITALELGDFNAP